MTGDEEWDTVTDFERSVTDVREAVCEAVFIITAMVIVTGFVWVVAAVTGHA